MDGRARGKSGAAARHSPSARVHADLFSSKIKDPALQNA